MTDVTRPNGETSDERRATDTGAQRRETATGTDRPESGMGTDRRDPAKTAEQRDPVKTAGPQDPAKAAEQRDPTKVTPVLPETVRGEQPSVRPVHAPEPPPSTPGAGAATDKRAGSNGSGSGSLLPHDESDKFSLRLQHAVTGFVDEPRSAVEEADHVLEEVAARFTEAVTKRRATLHGSWESKGSDGSENTEQLRLALRDYRELTERLLHI